MEIKMMFLRNCVYNSDLKSEQRKTNVFGVRYLSDDCQLKGADVLEDGVVSRLEEQSRSVVVHSRRKRRFVNDAFATSTWRLTANEVAAASQLPRGLDAVERATLGSAVKHFGGRHRLQRGHVHVRVLPTQFAEDINVFLASPTQKHRDHCGYRTPTLTLSTRSSINCY